MDTKELMIDTAKRYIVYDAKFSVTSSSLVSFKVENNAFVVSARGLQVDVPEKELIHAKVSGGVETGDAFRYRGKTFLVTDIYGDFFRYIDINGIRHTGNLKNFEDAYILK